MPRRPHGYKVRIDPEDPKHTSLCERCGSPVNRYNLREQLRFSGTTLFDTGFKFCERCLDIPNEQEKILILPPDPPPIFDALQVSFPFDMQSNYTIYASPYNTSLFGLNTYMSANYVYTKHH